MYHVMYRTFYVRIRKACVVRVERNVLRNKYAKVKNCNWRPNEQWGARDYDARRIRTRSRVTLCELFRYV